jgi:ubiquinone/menaquinone biosynthesis C-methylase UbiE
MKKLTALFSEKVNSKILDIGTGNGNFISIITQLTDNFCEIIGIDLVNATIEGCKHHFKDERINFFKMDVLDMEFEDDSFDFVCLSNSLHHLEDIKTSLSEMERVLKPGGALVFCEMVNSNLDKRQKSHLLLHHFAAEIDRERGNFHEETFSSNHILKILKEKSSLVIKDAWDLTYPKKDKNSKEEIEWLYKTLDRIMASLKDSDNIEYFEKKADKIKEYIGKHGFDSATSLIVVLK